MERGFAPVPPKEVVVNNCKDRNQVCRKLNKWIQHGWNLSRHFIQINWINTCNEYVVFYDSILDEEYVDKKKIV